MIWDKCQQIYEADSSHEKTQLIYLLKVDQMNKSQSLGIFITNIIKILWIVFWHNNSWHSEILTFNKAVVQINN